MPYDPNLPQPDTLADANQMRAQLSGLKDLIDAVPAITSAQVDAVNTLPAGEPATVAVSISGGVLHLTFGLPQGADGGEGPPGEVTAQDLADGLETRSHAVHGVAPLALTAEGEYSPTQLQDVANKVDEMLNVMKGS